MLRLGFIAQQFLQTTTVVDVQTYGSGNVNDTYLVTLNGQEAAIGADRFVLQRINQKVFHQPDLILVNMRVFSDFMRRSLAEDRNNAAASQQLRQGRRWEVPLIIPARDGRDFFVDEEGGFWRAISLVDHARTYPKVRDAAHAHEAGYALGRFHRLISDLDPGRLHDTLPGFHLTPQYLAHYDQVQARRQEPAANRLTDVAYGLTFVEQRRAWASVLEDARTQGRLAVRAMHGDPKVDNILIDDSTGHAVSIIDLDTVKPGLVHYDIGDCLRSCCNPAGEETTDLGAVTFDLVLCRNILEGYLGEAARFFTSYDYDYLYDAIRLIAFELGLRFFSDALAGNVYFKVRHPDHNLDRALVQFRLVECIEAQEGEIRRIIDELRQE
jgi:Ser/Thr protein kinase RdoA (MazF antagonist)